MKRRDDGGRGDLTHEQWQKLQPLLPPQKARTGKPAHDHRRIVNGIFWVHRTGAPWRDIPERYGNHHTISSRFYRWQQAGIWQNGQALPDAALRLLKDKLIGKCILLTVRLCAPTNMRRAQKGGSRGSGFGAQCWWFQHKSAWLIAEGFGKPLNFVLTGGERHETVAFPELVKGGK